MVAKDNGIPTLTATAWVEVEIIDVNDNAPHFTAPLYHFRVMENVEGTDVLGWVWAADADGPPYNSFFFSIAEISAGKLDESGGMGRGGGRIESRIEGGGERRSYNDYGNSYNAIKLDDEVSGYDDDVDEDGNKQQALPFKSNVKPSKLTISPDASLKGNLFEKNQNQRNKYSDKPRNMEIQADAQADAPTRTRRRMNGPTFSIDPRQGIIRYAGSFDREASAEHKLVVKATDIHDTTLTSTCVVMVTVDDDNDNAPFFVQPSTAVATVVKQEPLLKGHVLATLRASDADDAENAQVTYRLVSVHEKLAAGRVAWWRGNQGNGSKAGEDDSNGVFSIDARSGRLVCKQDFFVSNTTKSHDSIKNRSVVIEVMAIDNGKARRLNSSVHLRVVIVQRSKALHLNAWFSLSEHSLAWTLVTCLSTFLVVIVLLTAIALLACQREASIKASSVYENNAGKMDSPKHASTVGCCSMAPKSVLKAMIND